jgi:hypothetical protein
MTENRIFPTIRPDSVREVLPAYFTTDYPILVNFLEYYYQSMDSDGEFGEALKDIYQITDIGSTDLRYLNNLFYELGMNVSKDLFLNPREVLRGLADFFRSKGSKRSLEQFFRMFYNTEVEVFYPKDLIFQLNDPNSLLFPSINAVKVLQNGKLYQVLSLLIRTPIGFKEYEELYKRFVHPAGFYIGAEVNYTSEKVLQLSTFTDSNIIDTALKISDSYPLRTLDQTIPIIKSDIGNSDIVVFDGRSLQGITDGDCVEFLHDYENVSRYTGKNWFINLRMKNVGDSDSGYDIVLETAGHSAKSAMDAGYHDSREVHIAAIDPMKTLGSEDSIFPRNLAIFDSLANFSIYEADPNRVGIVELTAPANSTNNFTIDLKSLWDLDSGKVLRNDSKKYLTRVYLKGDYQVGNEIRISGLDKDSTHCFIAGRDSFSGNYADFTLDSLFPVVRIDDVINSNGDISLDLFNTSSSPLDVALVFAHKYNTIYDWIKYDSLAVFDINNFVYPDNRNIRNIVIQDIMNRNLTYLKGTII